MFKKTLAYLLAMSFLMTSAPVNTLAESMTEDVVFEEDMFMEDVEGTLTEEVFPDDFFTDDEEIAEEDIPLFENIPENEPEELPDDVLSGEIFSSPGLPEELSSTETICPENLADSDELFAEYVNRLFYGDADTSGRRKAGGNYTDLTGNNQIVFEALRDAAIQIASGSRTSTVVTITAEDLGVDIPYPAAELGVASLTDEEGNLRREAKDALISLTEFNKSIVVDHLLAKYPFEFYWFDKTWGIDISYHYIFDWDINGLYFSNTDIITISMAVSEDYIGNEPWTVNTAKTGLADTACTNANNVVRRLKNQSLSDLERLTAYKNYITSKVSYNRVAGNNDNAVPYGDPWQLIWVFDEDPSTNVVCEGYAKAFKYLCDLTGSDFNEAVGCCLITGNMTGGIGDGRHMWNTVTIGGSSYLVDIANSDEGTVGSDGELFMAGVDGYLSESADGSFAGYYVEIDVFGNDVVYILDVDNFQIYDPSILRISGRSYAEYPADPNDSSTDTSSQNDSIINDMDASFQDEGFDPAGRSLKFPDQAAIEAVEAARKAAEAAKFTLNVKKGASVPVALKKNNKNIHVVKLGDGDSLSAATSAAPAFVSAKLSGSSIVLKGLKSGKSAKITVTTQYGGSVTFTVKVQKKGAAVKTRSIKIAKTTTLRVGGTFDITTAINPVTTPDKMKFTIDKKGKKVISVSKKGIVTAKKTGKAKLTIQCGSKKKTVNIKVVG